MEINQMVKLVHELAKEKGWWDEDRSVGELIALMHSELSEALEEARKGKPVNHVYHSLVGTTSKHRYMVVKVIPSQADYKPEGVPAELADCVIRIMDFCGRYEIDLEKVLLEKFEFNKLRPRKHGKKF